MEKKLSKDYFGKKALSIDEEELDKEFGKIKNMVDDKAIIKALYEIDMNRRKE